MLLVSYIITDYGKLTTKNMGINITRSFYQTGLRDVWKLYRQWWL